MGWWGPGIISEFWDPLQGQPRAITLVSVFIVSNFIYLFIYLCVLKLLQFLP